MKLDNLNWVSAILSLHPGKAFLNHSAASDFETCFSSSPWSSLSLLFLSLECPEAMDKTSSSDCCIVRSSLSTLSQSSFNFQAAGLVEIFQPLTRQDDVHRVLDLADCYRGGVLVSSKFCRWIQGWLHSTNISKHVQSFLHSGSFKISLMLCFIEVLSRNNFLEKLPFVLILHCLYICKTPWSIGWIWALVFGERNMHITQPSWLLSSSVGPEQLSIHRIAFGGLMFWEHQWHFNASMNSVINHSIKIFEIIQVFVWAL